jgi:hypothetical protein
MQTIHILLLNDQPTTCPKCGGRTLFDEFGEGKGMYQIHKCKYPECSYEFVCMEDEEL